MHEDKQKTGGGEPAMPELLRDGFLRLQSLSTVSISPEFMRGLQTAVSVGHDSGSRALYRIGRCWGQAWYQRLATYARDYHDTMLGQLPMELFQQLMGTEFERTGWGKCAFDLDTFADDGLLVITVAGGPANSLSDELASGAAMLMAGYFSAILSSLAELPFEGIGLCSVEGSVAVAHVVLVHESRLSLVRPVWERGGGLTEIIQVLRDKRAEA